MNFRIGGIASGLDTETMMKSLVNVERMRRSDPLYQQKQILEWKREDYRGINTRLMALRTSALKMKLESTFMGKQSISSDQGVVKAAAGSTAVNGNYSITVHNLASGVNAVSMSTLGSSTGKTTLAEQFSGIPATVTFSLEGKNGPADFSFDTATTGINEVIAEINGANIGITAFYDQNLDRFFMKTTDTGTQAMINIIGDGEGFLRDNLKMYSGDLAVPGTPVNLGIGQDAIVDFDGLNGLTFSSNQFTLTGISFNLTGSGSATVTVSNDIDGIIGEIKSFVEAYNAALEQLAGKLGEKKNRDYPPLTDEQKKEMSERDIELWEKQARSGLLQADAMLNSIYSATRMNAMNQVEGLSPGNTYSSLSSIGINTAGYREFGKLYINEDKLRQALSSNPEGVKELFTKDGATEGNQGIAYRLYDSLNNSINRITSKAGSSAYIYDSSFLGQEIENISKRIDTAEERLNAIENRYWKQFTAMEKALQLMNSQSMWLTQQLEAYNRR